MQFALLRFVGAGNQKESKMYIGGGMLLLIIILILIFR